MPLGNRTIIKTVTAKKEYQCDLCQCIIESGEHCQTATAQKDGKFISFRYCIMESWKDIHAHVRRIKEAM